MRQVKLVGRKEYLQMTLEAVTLRQKPRPALQAASGVPASRDSCRKHKRVSACVNRFDAGGAEGAPEDDFRSCHIEAEAESGIAGSVRHVCKQR